MAFTNIATTPSLAGIGTVVETTFRSSTPLQGNPTVTIGGLPMTFVSLVTGLYRYQRTVQATDGDGLVDVHISGTDTGGSPVSGDQLGACTFDVTPPAITNLSVTPALAKAGTDVTVTFRTSETVVANPTVTIGGTAVNFISLVTGLYTYRYSVLGSEPEGLKDVVVTANDLAGNPGTQTLVGAVRFDFTAPLAQNFTCSPAVATSGSTLTVTFRLSESPVANPSVDLGPLAMSFISLVTGTYTYRVTLTGAEPEGSAAVAITAADAAGNSGTTTKPAATTFDFTRPTCTILAKEAGGSSFVALRSAYNAANKPIAFAFDVLEANLDEAGSTALVSGTPHSFASLDSSAAPRYVLNAPALAEGANHIAAQLVDLAGQTNAGPLEHGFSLDTIAPSAQLLISLDDGATWVAAPGGTPIYNQPIRVALEIPDASFNDLHFDDGVQSGPFPSTMTINGALYTLDYAHFTYEYLAGSNSHRLAFKDPLTVDGLNTIGAYLQDTSGNGSPAYSFDCQLAIPPEGQLKVSTDGLSYADAVALYTASQVWLAVESPAADLDLAHCKFTISGAASGASDVFFSGLTPIGLGNGLQRWVCPTTISDDDVYTINVTLQDTGGLTNTVAIGAGFEVDTQAPSGALLASLDGGTTWLPAQASYPAGPLALCCAVPTAVTDLDEGASWMEVEYAGSPAVHLTLAALGAPTTVGSDTCYAWPTALTALGHYIVRFSLVDDHGLASTVYEQGLDLNPPRFSFATSGYHAPDDLLVSHTHDDGTDNDPTGLILWSSTADNYMAVRVQNAAGAGSGDCRYRIFVVPACLFTGTSQWRIVNDDDGGAPTVAAVPPGGSKISTGNRNFNASHPNFPDDPAFWATYADGDLLHCCVCAVLHGTHDPLLIPDGGGTRAVTDAEFDGLTQFGSVVLGAIDSYNGSSGGYWDAVRDNDKIINVNLDIKNVGT